MVVTRGFKLLSYKRLLLRAQKHSTSFEQLGITNELIQRLSEKNIASPTQIQERSIPLVFQGKDLVINAETGSGKTLCYLLPIIQNILKKVKNNSMAVPIPKPSAIIFAPSVELIHQIKSVCHSLVDEEVMDVCAAHRQSPIYLRKNTHILITHPEYFSKYKLTSFFSAETLVFDEADILATSCYTKVANIISQFQGTLLSLKKKRRSFPKRKHLVPSPDHPVQCLCIGATMPARNRRSALPTIRYCLPHVETVASDLVHMGIPSLRSANLFIEEDEKQKVFLELLVCGRYQNVSVDLNTHLLVFFSSTSHVSRCFRHVKLALGGDMVMRNIEQLHGELTPNERLQKVKTFEENKASILLTTDIAARGLDFSDVTVIQYDYARNVADILHRAGRTARGGCAGKMISFVTNEEKDISQLFEEALAEKKAVSHLFSRSSQLKRIIEMRKTVVNPKNSVLNDSTDLDSAK